MSASDESEFRMLQIEWNAKHLAFELFEETPDRKFLEHVVIADPMGIIRELAKRMLHEYETNEELAEVCRRLDDAFNPSPQAPKDGE